MFGMHMLEYCLQTLVLFICFPILMDNVTCTRKLVGTISKDLKDKKN